MPISLFRDKEPAPSRSSVWGGALIGRRSEQQDAFLAEWLPFEQAWLIAIADGMGGHNAGATASRIAIEEFRNEFVRLRSAGAGLEHALRTSIETANSHIAREQQRASERAGMGTTIVAGHHSDRGLAWISIGDSPLWLFRRHSLRRLNDDHSLRAVAKAGTAVQGNALLSALHGEPPAMVDCHADPVPTCSGDLVLFASDGILTLGDRRIEDRLGRCATAHPETIARSLLSDVAAHDDPRQDNCTVVVLSVSGSGPRRLLGRAMRRLRIGKMLAASVVSVLPALLSP